MKKMTADKHIWEGITEVFREVFKDPSLVIKPEDKNSDIQEWNSLSHAMLIDALEKKFSVNFDFDDILNMQSVNDIYSKIKELAQL